MKKFILKQGDCLEVMKKLSDNSITAIVTDPPYGLEFMGKAWDSFSNNTNSALGKQSPANLKEKTPFKTRGKPIGGWCKKDREANKNFQEWNVEWLKEALRVTKPGGFALVFGGTRTHHRLMVAMEDAGWQIRDCMMWLYGSGFPKSYNISKGLDKKLGKERPIVGITKSGGFKTQMVRNKEQGFRPDDYYKDGNKFTSNESISNEAKLWDGYGTALKPAWEPIIVVMKPVDVNFAENAMKHGVAGLNIDRCRVEFSKNDDSRVGKEYKHKAKAGLENGKQKNNASGNEQSLHHSKGRFPANIILDEESGKMLDEQSGVLKSGKWNGKRNKPKTKNCFGKFEEKEESSTKGSSGGASRFFYCAKASKKERGEGNNHPTVKPLNLMQYLVGLVKMPKNNLILDPFCGSGSTGIAVLKEGMNFVGIEKEEEYFKISKKRLGEV